MSRQAGLTLIELLVVVAVMVILATIAYPLYTKQIMKARRAEARVALNEIALAQERFFTVNGRYGTTAQLGTAYTEALGKMTDRDGDSSPDYYAIAVASTTTTFSVTADAAGAQASDSCTQLTINQTGVRGGTGSLCW